MTDRDRDRDRDRLIELLKQSGDVETWNYHTDDFKRPDPIESLAIYLIANGVTVNEWLPASEPPVESGEYNVMVEGGTVTTTLFYSKLNKGWFEFNDDDYMFPHTITHWMPLPQPPKGEKE